MTDISFFDMIPDVETYHELRASVDWVVFCREQSEKALKNSIKFSSYSSVKSVSIAT